MNQQLPSRPTLRLVIEPTRARQHAWYESAERDGRNFLMRHGHALSEPCLAYWVVEQCAELVWEWQPEEPSWSALRVGELWQRLDNLHRFFPLPRLVVAHHETLTSFLPWLSSRGQLDRRACTALLDELARASSPMLEEALATLRARAHR